MRPRPSTLPVWVLFWPEWEECGSFLRMDSDDEEEEELLMSRDTSEILPSLSDGRRHSPFPLFIFDNTYLKLAHLGGRGKRSPNDDEQCEQVRARAVMCGWTARVWSSVVL